MEEWDNSFSKEYREHKRSGETNSVKKRKEAIFPQGYLLRNTVKQVRRQVHGCFTNEGSENAHTRRGGHLEGQSLDSSQRKGIITLPEIHTQTSKRNR